MWLPCCWPRETTPFNSGNCAKSTFTLTTNAAVNVPLDCPGGTCLRFQPRSLKTDFHQFHFRSQNYPLFGNITPPQIEGVAMRIENDETMQKKAMKEKKGSISWILSAPQSTTQWTSRSHFTSADGCSVFL